MSASGLYCHENTFLSLYNPYFPHLFVQEKERIVHALGEYDYFFNRLLSKFGLVEKLAIFEKLPKKDNFNA